MAARRGQAGQFKKGDKKKGGRKRGTPNKVTVELKEMILGALSAKGGQKYLERQADENPKAFMALLGRTLPYNMGGSVEFDLSKDSLNAITAKFFRPLKQDS